MENKLEGYVYRQRTTPRNTNYGNKRKEIERKKKIPKLIYTNVIFLTPFEK